MGMANDIHDLDGKEVSLGIAEVDPVTMRIYDPQPIMMVDGHEITFKSPDSVLSAIKELGGMNAFDLGTNEVLTLLGPAGSRFDERGL